MAKEGFSTLPDVGTRQAWLVMLKSEYRRLGGGSKYDDDPESRYSWDSTVANHLQVKAGDIVLLWNESGSLGASVIEKIAIGKAIKRRGRCVNDQCRSVNYEPRKTIRPVFRCYDCESLFDDPIFEDVDVTTFRSSHGQAWVDLSGQFTAAELRALCVKPKSQNSFRALRWDAVRALAADEMGGDVFGALDATTRQIQGGHVVRPTRVRRGQKDFRQQLLSKYNNRCAFTGTLPPAVLDACHLYSFAKVGKHHEHGGVLLRRDLHTLFDRGHIAVDHDGRIDVSEEYRRYPAYEGIHGQLLTITTTPEQRGWFELHWAEHRKSTAL
ncbi:HNH endonuclease [Nocardia tengchongensis]|uniref:HNH endonuclease n=1 Tax=Nocardia tengchongensis TaxID=2055889 RepID=UPI00365617A4